MIASFSQMAPEAEVYNLRGHSVKVYVQRCAKTVRKTLFSVCNSWNSLPQHVIEAQSTNSYFIQEQTRQILVRYGRMKASAAELINIKYQVSSKYNERNE